MVTQCYLPPSRGDIPAFTPAKAGTRFRDPGGMQGWLDLGGWLEMVYPLNGHPSWTNRARCWLTSLMRPMTLTTTPSHDTTDKLHHTMLYSCDGLWVSTINWQELLHKMQACNASSERELKLHKKRIPNKEHRPSILGLLQLVWIYDKRCVYMLYLLMRWMHRCRWTKHQFWIGIGLLQPST